VLPEGDWDYQGETNLKEVLMSWSGGKDSCLALYEVQQSHEYQVGALLTTITEDYGRISMHGVRCELLEQQVAAFGLSLHRVLISKDATNQEYETKFIAACDSYIDKGIDSIIFGDLFLEDIRRYRDELLARHNLRGIYPVWLRNTTELINKFIELGFKAIVTCVDAKVLGPEFAGQLVDNDFVSSLPPFVDPCGENGEFHTFVFDGPNFKQPVRFSQGEIVQREGFWFCDLLPES
jgi:uncharacterized protein (TIGR00290 family)